MKKITVDVDGREYWILSLQPIGPLPDEVAGSVELIQGVSTSCANVFVCPDCGCVVGDTFTHNKFHQPEIIIYPGPNVVDS